MHACVFVPQIEGQPVENTDKYDVTVGRQQITWYVSWKMIHSPTSDSHKVLLLTIKASTDCQGEPGRVWQTNQPTLDKVKPTPEETLQLWEWDGLLLGELAGTQFRNTAIKINTFNNISDICLAHSIDTEHCHLNKHESDTTQCKTNRIVAIFVRIIRSVFLVQVRPVLLPQATSPV